MKRRTHRDPVTPELRIEVLERDQGCIGWRMGIPTICGGRLELDHVRTGGLSLRSRSTADNLVVLCTACHRYKTEHGREVRPLELAYLASVGEPER